MLNRASDIMLGNSLNHFIETQPIQYVGYLAEIVRGSEKEVGLGYDLQCCNSRYRVPSRDGYTINYFKKEIRIHQRLKPSSDEHIYLSGIIRKMIDIDFLSIEKPAIVKSVRSSTDTIYGLLGIGGGLATIISAPALPFAAAAIAGTVAVAYGANSVVKGVTFEITHKKHNGEEGVDLIKYGTDAASKMLYKLYPFKEKVAENTFTNKLFAIIDAFGKVQFDGKGTLESAFTEVGNFFAQAITSKKHDFQIEIEPNVYNDSMIRKRLRTMIEYELDHKRVSKLFA